ncbi:helix-turn-helix domain-containing protein [Halomonas sp. AOP27-A1-34]|uniref:helix-turn-helix domain-containing protein n=1 Tax=Halomonas sp. AOP27-A1-34 TaxID=3457708 RepID=UPI0040334454
MSMMLMAKAFGIKVGNANRKLVLLKLADNANDDGECFPSYQHIADQCEMGRSTVKGHIKALAEAGYLVIQVRNRPGYQTSNSYKLTLDNGKKLERKKPNRPGKSKGSAADLPQSAVDRDGSAADLPRSAVDLAPRSAADHRTYHSFEPVSEPVSNHSLSGASESQSSVFERAAQQTDDGEPAADDLTQPRKTAMHLEWEPEPETYAVACYQRGLDPETSVFVSAALIDFREHFAAQPARTNTHADWTRRFVRWVAENAKRQQTAVATAGGHHATRRNSTPKRRLTAQEARAAAEGRAPEPPGRTFDGEWASTDRF